MARMMKEYRVNCVLVTENVNPNLLDVAEYTLITKAVSEKKALTNANYRCCLCSKALFPGWRFDFNESKAVPNVQYVTRPMQLSLF